MSRDKQSISARWGARLALALGLAWLSSSSSAAHAQNATDPDLRNVEPFVMVIVDTSGSMERLPNCACVTAGCTECLPHCSDVDAPGPTDLPTRNRWAFTLEALTGGFNDFRCKKVDRTQANGATYDLGYYLPYHQPWHCPGTAITCAAPTTVTVGATTMDFQAADGVLDTYSSRLRFGLMTFDGMDTYFGALPLIHQSDFQETLSESQAGMWSYAGSHSFHYPNCTEDYKMDTGARSGTAVEGSLVSANSNVCPNPPCDIYQINANIQDTLLRTRPFGGTPIAASLDDLYYHFKNDYDDPFGACRKRYALLITDGYPDDDYRSYGCDCKKEMNCPPNEIADLMHCPYPTAEEVAKDLVTGRTGDTKQMEKLFVIGISVDDTAVRDRLNAIASEGGSTDLEDGNTARFADDRAALSSTLDKLFGQLTDPVTRAVPTFAYSRDTSSNGVKQYQVTAGFQKALGPIENGVAPPWTGIIERQRITCVSNLAAPQPIAANQGDTFQDVLNDVSVFPNLDRTKRDLWTVVLGSRPVGFTHNDQITRLVDDSSLGVGFCGNTNDGNCVVTPVGSLLNPELGIQGTDNTRRDQIRAWMYGDAGSVRAGKRLGDIYHSSPVIPPLPPTSATDQTYRDFVQRPEVATRPNTMYVGTNDGILHAFAIEPWSGAAVNAPSPNQSRSFVAGQEMWGFVPPMKLDDLNSQLSGHQFSMDGVPVVKDVFFKQTQTGTTSTADYHTVLITGMRRGGRGYVALDVTDPINPKFMWQFTQKEMGFTYGQPVIAQLQVDWPNGSGTIETQKRAVAILSGGAGHLGDASDCGGRVTTDSLRDPSTLTPYGTLPRVPTTTGTDTPLLHRYEVRCWKGRDKINPTDDPIDVGRALYFVDVESGHLIKKIFLTNPGSPTSSPLFFPSPLIGSPTVYPDGVGALATEGFVVDADGVIWRIDLRATDPAPTDPMSGWTVRPFHDIFWDKLPGEGQTSYEIPILSVDDQKHLVVIVGTGDTDNFGDLNADNRVVSLTEVSAASTSGTLRPEDFKAAFNWEQRVKSGSKGFVKSELVTGTMALFDGRLIFATFISVVNSGNACDLGRGRLWSVDYKARDDNDDNGSGTFGPLRIDLTAEELGQDAATSQASAFNVDVNGAHNNLMIFGLGATQPPACLGSTTTDFVDDYFSPGMPKIAFSSPPSIWIAAQAAGGALQSNSKFGSLRLALDRKPKFAHIGSWAGSTD